MLPLLMLLLLPHGCPRVCRLLCHIVRCCATFRDRVGVRLGAAVREVRDARVMMATVY